MDVINITTSGGRKKRLYELAISSRASCTMKQVSMYTRDTKRVRYVLLGMAMRVGAEEIGCGGTESWCVLKNGATGKTAWKSFARG